MSNAKYLQKLKSVSLSLLEVPEKKKLTEKQIAVLKTINNRQFGCQTDNVADFASAFCEIDLKAHMTNGDIKPGTILRIEKSIANYTVDTFVCMITGGHAYCPVRNSYGDNDIRLEALSRGKVRRANKKEVISFYKEVESMERFFDVMNSYSPIKENG